jgi:hypothetical protein
MIGFSVDEVAKGLARQAEAVAASKLLAASLIALPSVLIHSIITE